MEGSPRPDTPGNLEASMLIVIDEVDSCLERILVRRSSITNPTSTRNSSNMVSPVNETITEQSREGIPSDNSSDATIELDNDYATGQLSTSGITNGSSDEVVSVEELGTQSLPINVPLPHQLRSEDNAAEQPSTSGVAWGGSDEMMSVEELGTQSVILPESVPLPRQLQSEEVIDLSDSLTSYSPRGSTRNPHRFPAVDVIELSSDEEGPSTSRPTVPAAPPTSSPTVSATPSTSRSTVAPQPLMHITYSTCTSRPSSQSTNIVIDLRPPTFSYGSVHSPQPSNAGTIYTLDSPGNGSPVIRRNGRIQLWNPRKVDTPKRSKRIVPQPSSANSDDTKIACPICYESLFERRLLSTICGHVFCEPCLRTALNMSKKCPICNRSIKKANHMHPLYLPLNQP